MARLPERVFTAAEVDAAVARISDPERLQHAQEVVTHAAPSLQKVLGEALAEGGYFSSAHEEAVEAAAREEDPEQRVRLVRTLVAEEARLGMFVGAAVGFELHRELNRTPPQE